jgi:hypothetical protein
MRRTPRKELLWVGGLAARTPKFSGVRKEEIKDAVGRTNMSYSTALRGYLGT